MPRYPMPKFLFWSLGYYVKQHTQITDIIIFAGRIHNGEKYHNK